LRREELYLCGAWFAALDGPSTSEVKAAIARITEVYAQNGRGIRLVAVSGGFQFRTAPENATWVRALLRERPARLGRAAMETLAIVAYKQPATRADVEAIRGVDADSALNTLLQKRLIKIAGRKEAAGRPLMYATTPEFSRSSVERPARAADAQGDRARSGR
jgi:segregation and condensation protein B